jgi:dipeptidyl aminopeptidase/acylaminoacyl peptidase
MLIRSVPGLVIALALAGALVLGREGPTPARLQAQAPPAPSSPGTSASGALQRGITLMETRNDCAGAIREFTTAARSPEPIVAARALLLRGQCEERLGRAPAARGSYERLLREFPGSDIVIEARRRLDRLAAAAAEGAFPRLSVRRLAIPSQVPSGSVSRDGRFLAYHDEKGAARRRSLVTGETELLTFGPNPVDGAAAVPLLLSPDGERMAYMWGERALRGNATEPTRIAFELRVMTLPGGAVETLVPRGDARTVRPVAWSADGRQVFALETDAAYRVRLIAVDVASREVQRLADFAFFEPFRVSPAPTGRAVAYDAPTAGAARDIFLLDTQTRTPLPIVRHPANDVLPEFLPDGRGVLFVSDRLGPLSLWLQRLKDGRPDGEAQIVRRDIGRFWPIGLTSTGTFVHALQTTVPDIHVARAGDSGRFEEVALPLTAQFAGQNSGPDWSTDGTAMAYVSLRGAMSTGPGSRLLVVRDRTTGVERPLVPDLMHFGDPRWSPDGTRILVRGQGVDDKYGFFLVDARTGAVQPVFAMDDIERETDLGAFQWKPGREVITYALNNTAIRELDLRTGVSTDVLPLRPGLRITSGRGVAWDKDARRLAYSTFEAVEKSFVNVLYLREADGTTRELLRATRGDDLRLMGWIPDGQSLLALRSFESRDGPDAKIELWRIPVDGTAPVFTGIAQPGLRQVAMHPSGREVAYVYGSSSWETGVMEGIR